MFLMTVAGLVQIDTTGDQDQALIYESNEINEHITSLPNCKVKFSHLFSKVMPEPFV